MARELELYVHIPFCIHKCSYCDFLSAPAPELVRERYLNQLLAEMDAVTWDYKDCKVTSIFVGGGTPSCMSETQTQALFEGLRRFFQILPDAEITFECNPGTLTAEKLRTFKEVGINRLSIGLQSANDRELQLLGRIHTYRQFLDNYDQARTLGFDNINIDVISALPGQTAADYETTIRRVTELYPEHISAYSLIIEEGTPFYDHYGEADRLRAQGKEQNLLPSEDEERRMYELTRTLLGEAGYHRYEISNYALELCECRHNNGYWQRRNYLGLGLGAASMVDNVRFSNCTDLQEYLQIDFQNDETACIERKVLEKKEQMEEFLILGLRRMEGVSGDAFWQQFGVRMEQVYGDIIKKQMKEGLLATTAKGYRLTDFGIDVSNRVMAEYL